MKSLSTQDGGRACGGQVSLPSVWENAAAVTQDGSAHYSRHVKPVKPEAFGLYVINALLIFWFAHLLCMHSKVLNLAQGDGLVLTGALIRGLVAFRVGAECANLHFAASHGAHWVNNHSQERLLQSSSNPVYQGS
jgi:hypothetical protein